MSVLLPLSSALANAAIKQPCDGFEVAVVIVGSAAIAAVPTATAEECLKNLRLFTF